MKKIILTIVFLYVGICYSTISPTWQSQSVVVDYTTVSSPGEKTGEWESADLSGYSYNESLNSRVDEPYFDLEYGDPLFVLDLPPGGEILEENTDTEVYPIEKTIPVSGPQTTVNTVITGDFEEYEYEYHQPFKKIYTTTRNYIQISGELTHLYYCVIWRVPTGWDENGFPTDWEVYSYSYAYWTGIQTKEDITETTEETYPGYNICPKITSQQPVYEQKEVLVGVQQDGTQIPVNSPPPSDSVPLSAPIDISQGWGSDEITGVGGYKIKKNLFLYMFPDADVTKQTMNKFGCLVEISDPNNVIRVRDRRYILDDNFVLPGGKTVKQRLKTINSTIDFTYRGKRKTLDKMTKKIIWELRKHNGLDIGYPEGTPIKPETDGLVIRAKNCGGTEADPNFGNQVIVYFGKLPDGRAVFGTYSHLKDMKVAPGDNVDSSTNLGGAGRSGRPYESHLHYEIRVVDIPSDFPQDPNNLPVNVTITKWGNDMYNIIVALPVTAVDPLRNSVEQLLETGVVR